MLDKKLVEYLKGKIPEKPLLLEEMEAYAKKEHIPIMEPYSMEVLLQLLRLYRPKHILEIGTALGYSAIRMAMATGADIVTVERDERRIREAKNYIGRANMTDRIRLLEGDALEIADQVKKFGPFDCLFIDAAKVQYKGFFTKYEGCLTKGAVIFTDNVLFKGYVYNSNLENKKLQRIGRKMDEYNEWLFNHPSYHTIILPIGDGISVSVPKDR